LSVENDDINKIINTLKIALCCIDADASFNYKNDGNIDSLNFVRFVLSIEKLYSISFTDAEIESEEFNTIGGLATIIQRKIS